MTPRTTLVAALPVLLVVLAGGCGQGAGTSPGTSPGSDEAGAGLRDHRSAVRDLLADLGRPLVARGEHVDLRGAFEGCRSDARQQGYRSWTYAGGGRIAGGATLDDLERLLVRVGASDVTSRRGEVSGTRDGVDVVVTRHATALVVVARATACIDVPDGQEEVWLDREQRPRVPVRRAR